MAKKKSPPSPVWAVVILLVGAIFWVQKHFDGNIPWNLSDLLAGLGNQQVASTPYDWTKNDNTVRIASFNIQVFGQSKLDKPEVVEALARTIRFFDVVAIQEIRSIEQNILPEFIAAINSEGSQYSYVIGPRLGRTSSKEQYAYIFDTTKIELVEGTVQTIQEPAGRDLLHREPLVAQFRTRREDDQTPFSFVLVNIHTDPDEVDIEVNALDDVYRAVQQWGADDDVILLGDLNASARKLGELRDIPGIQWVIDGTPTNTRGTESYDNILFTRNETREFTGQGGVFDLASEFGLSDEQMLEISDHLPVWGEFSATESPRQLAANTETTLR